MGHNAGDEIVVTLKYSIPGAPGTLVKIATAILPGDGSVTFQMVLASRNW